MRLSRSILLPLAAALLLALAACSDDTTGAASDDPGAAETPAPSPSPTPGNGGGNASPQTPTPSGLPLGFTCVAINGGACQGRSSGATAFLATVPDGALELDAGIVSNTIGVQVTVDRADPTEDTRVFVVAYIVEGRRCNGDALPDSGWQWYGLMERRFGVGDLSWEFDFSVQCYTLEAGPGRFWILLARGTFQDAELFSDWTYQQGRQLPPTEAIVAQHVDDWAVVEFTAVPQ